MKHLQTGR